jgi:5-formyltetrahydrofolate cyclo-ligase
MDMNKKEIRKHMLLVRRDMSSEDVESASEAVYKNLMLLDEYKACSRIYVYLDYNHEVKTDKIIKKALLDGKEVYVPRIDGDVMNFYKFTSFDDVSEGYKGIPEPSKESVIDNERRGLLLMPLLAWDKHFNRVGYGKGFYDQYISRKHGDFLRIGLAFKTQYVDEIEDSAMTDMPMHMVITDDKILVNGKLM